MSDSALKKESKQGLYKKHILVAVSWLAYAGYEYFNKDSYYIKAFRVLAGVIISMVVLKNSDSHERPSTVLLPTQGVRRSNPNSQSRRRAGTLAGLSLIHI